MDPGVRRDEDDVIKLLGGVDGQLSGMAKMVEADRLSAPGPERRAHWWCA